MKGIELKKVFITNIVKNLNNGSLLLDLVPINNDDDFNNSMDNREPHRHSLKLFLDREAQIFRFRYAELEAEERACDIPFKNFTVITNNEVNIFIFISDIMIFDFISLRDDYYQILLQFLIEHNFDIMYQQLRSDDGPLEDIQSVNNKPVYLN